MTHDGIAHTSNFSELLGLRQETSGPDEVVCRMEVTESLANRNAVLHGGALMSLVDHAAGTLALAHCPAGMTTVTVEAKTNFFRAVTVGDVVTAVARPLHAGRSTVVVQVSTTRGDGKELSSTTQTQLLLEWDGGGQPGRR